SATSTRAASPCSSSSRTCARLWRLRITATCSRKGASSPPARRMSLPTAARCAKRISGRNFGVETRAPGGSSMTDRSNDPAFLYFPDHYRWSMGLLMCLGGAPWGGAEIDEVNRVGRALRDKVGDDDAWFTEWTRMGERVEARGRVAAREGHALTAA